MSIADKGTVGLIPVTRIGYTTRWQTRNHQALAEITLTLKKEPLRNVKRYQLASEIWNYLEDYYEGRGQHTMARLLGDVFRTTLVDMVPMEQQLSNMRDKVHRLRDLGHNLKDSLIATVMIISLLVMGVTKVG